VRYTPHPQDTFEYRIFYIDVEDELTWNDEEENIW
jgi:hypothetical protein